MISTKTSAEILRQAVEQSDKRLKPFRKSRQLFLAQYGGPHYGKVGDAGHLASDNPEPLNTLFSTASILVPHLVFRNAKTYATASRRGLRNQADILAMAIDHLLAEIDFRRTMRMVVTDALFSVGITKTGLAPGAVVEGLEEPDGYLHDTGQPYCDHISLDNYVVDPNALCREQAAFEGNRYRLPLDYVRECRLYKKTDKLHVRQEPSPETGARMLSMGEAAPDRLNEFTEYVELIDLWLPHENAIVTIPAPECGPAFYLSEEEYEGPERGPFEFLTFHDMPDNSMPIAPISTSYDLHVLLNIMARKAGRQAERDKTVGLYSPLATEDAENVRAANDGEMVAVKDPNAVKELHLGGASDKVMQQVDFLSAKVSEMAGNTDLIGGMSSKSPTATQDQMLMQRATARLDDMQEQFHVFAKHNIEKLAWYLWTDPLIHLPMVKREEGMDVEYVFSAEDREGDFLDYNIDLEPASMAHRSPQQQYRQKMEFLTTAVLAMAQLSPAIGQALDPMAVLTSVAKDLDIPNIDEWFVPTVPLGSDAMPEGAVGGDMQGDSSSAGGGVGGAPSPQPTGTPQPTSGAA